MGFYGNVFYQLANSFGKFIIKNSGIDSSDVKIAGLTHKGVESSAIGLDAIYTFDTGNKWIKLVANAENAETKIYHSGNGVGADSIPTLTKAGSLTDAITADVELSAGDYLNVPSLTYDEAGHVTGIKETKCFKLPVSEVESDIVDLKTKMDTVLENDTTQTSDITSLKERCDDLEAGTSFIGNKTSFTNATSTSDTITNTIGNIVDLRKRYTPSNPTSEEDYDWESSGDTLNLCRAVADIDSRIKVLKSSIDIIGLTEDQQLDNYDTILEAINTIDGHVNYLSLNYQELLTRIRTLEEKMAALES